MTTKIMFTMYDAGIDSVWQHQLNKYSAGILNVKNPTMELMEATTNRFFNIILHLYISGFETTSYEPMLNVFYMNVDMLRKANFQVQRLVFVINPVIPTKRGIDFLHQILSYLPFGCRVKLKFINQDTMFLSKLKSLGMYKLDMPWTTPTPPKELKMDVLKEFNSYPGKFRSVSVCCDDDIPAIYREPCVGKMDYEILRLQRVYKGKYIPVNKKCTCARSRVNVYGSLKVPPYVWFI